jgi:hypothetical protein
MKKFILNAIRAYLKHMAELKPYWVSDIRK